MATIVVHGTMTTCPAHHINWWWRSWNEGGFLHGMVEGMTAACGKEDIWKVGGILVENIEALRPGQSFWTGRMGQFSQHKGYFMWIGGDSYAERDAGAEHLARYLSKIVEIAPQEPLRLVAHSHGCNVVKKASSHPKLAPSVHIQKAVFLACPHFETQSAHDSEQFYPYRIEPTRFGRILNLYADQDTVQTDIAERLPSTMMSVNWREWTPPVAYRTDQDPRAKKLYQDLHLVTQDGGIAAHAALHGVTIGRLVGLWLEGATDTFGSIARTIVPQGDHGEG
jgi:hypothetical protein